MQNAQPKKMEKASSTSTSTTYTGFKRVNKVTYRPQSPRSHLLSAGVVVSMLL